MPAVQYPFIDIAVHERVKDHFARGEAIVLFSLDLADVLWANGPGAELFGKPVIYDLIEDGPSRNDVTFRQVEASGQQLRAPGDTRNFLIRIPAGFQRIPVQAIVERIHLTRDVDALLFAAPVSSQPLKPETIARSMLEGFDDPDTHMAVLGGDGEILAASAGFASLGLTPGTARTLVSMAASHPDRLVKRPVPTGKGYLPAAIGKVSAEPAMHLLFAVETILGNMGPATGFPEETQSPSDEAPVSEPLDLVEQTGLESVATPIEDALVEETAPGTIEAAADEADDTFIAEASDQPANSQVEEQQLSLIAQADEPVPDTEFDSIAAGVSMDDEPVELDTPANEVSIPDTVEPLDGFRFDRAARPTRFVWKIDADGNFSEVSPELAAAVGPHAAMLAGTSFGDIAHLLDLDPEGKIAELLGRRDTWSGKTIYWPIEGTALKAPVDLAALPTYRRNREFDGFRGFGIVRLSDSVDDPHEIGLTLGGSAGIIKPETQTMEETQALSEEAAHIAPVESAAPVPEIEGTETMADGPSLEPELEPDFDHEREEPPVLRVSTTPMRRESDKVIKLEERRTRSRDGLTPGEQEAFREIARQLEPFRRDETDEAFDGSDPGDETDSGYDDISLAVPDAPEPEEAAALDEESVAETGSMVPQADTPVSRQDPASPASETEQLEILATLIPARTSMDGGLTGAVLDEIPVALLIHAGDDLIHANAEFLRLSGYGSLADLEAVGGLDSLLHHKDLEDMPDHSGGLSLVRADDELVPVTARLQSVRWEDTHALLLALIPSGLRTPAESEHPILPDISDVDEERLNARVEELQVEVEELRSILETATDGVVIIGPEGNIRSMNRSAAALFDYDDAETGGKPFVMLFAHESHRAVADYLAGMTGHGVQSVLNDGREVIGREASGGFIPLFMTIGKLSVSNGFCAVIRDITQWKRSEEDLKNAKRAAETANAHKSDFLARVSHEIRTPLNAIIGFSDMMAIEHFGPIGHPRYVEYANDIARSGRLVLDIVNDLLDISKIEAGEMDLEFTAVGLNDAVSEAVSLVQPQAHTQRVIIRTAFSDAVPDVVADLRSVKQIVLNILANAIRFTQAGGQIVVSTAYEPNGSVVLRIRDTGVGMTRAELEQAMKPFRQVTTGTRKRGDGTGLGLPLTKAMVDANRAGFTIQSAPNEGTLVEITFPSPRVLAN